MKSNYTIAAQENNSKPVIIAEVSHTTIVDSPNAVSMDWYEIPIDPMDDLHCDSCQ